MKRFAKVDDSQIHRDYRPNGIAPKIGKALQMIAAEGQGLNETNPSSLAEAILRNGDHQALPILADALDETEHPMKDAFDWRHAPRAIAIDRALKSEIDRHRVRGFDIDRFRWENQQLTPGWVMADWKDGRKSRVSKRRAVEVARQSVPDANLKDVSHSLLRLFHQWYDSVHTSDPEVYLPSEMGKNQLQNDKINLQRLGSPDSRNIHTYPDARKSDDPARANNPEQKRRGKPSRFIEADNAHSWLKPDGTFIPLEGKYHDEYARKIGKSVPELWQEGWHRVTYTGGRLYTDNHLMRPNRKQMKALVDTAIERGFSHIIHDSGDDDLVIWSDQDRMSKGKPTRLQSFQSPAGGLVARGTFYQGGKMLPKEATQTAPRPESTGILASIVKRLKPKKKKVQQAV